MEANTDILKLFNKYLNGPVSEPELQQLLDFFGSKQADESLKDRIRLVLESQQQIEDVEIERIGEEVKLRLAKQLKPKENGRSLWIYLAAAAAILLAVSIATIYFFDLGKIPQTPAVQFTSEKIQPGSDKAILVLSDGRQLSLSDSSNTVVADGVAGNVAEVKNGMINYLLGNNEGVTNENVYNKILVPKGGQYKVVLPDGSKAWLNAGSSLRYALNFGKASRILELTGEGYFEVVKNKKLPFTVKSSSLEVTALGTQFNVNTYTNEPYGAATLVEGSLRVTESKSQKTVILTPGQQAITVNGLLVRQVNSYDLTAWKDGLFVISKAGLDDVMRQVERWYNVTAEVKLPNTANTFSGEFPRDIPLTDLLLSLEAATGIKIKVEGRRIVTR